MTRLKVLFADDQIPDEEIPDEDVVMELRKKYPGAPPGFINAFLPLRQAVKTLRDGYYDVTVARTYQEALAFIKTIHFDIAIVDLRWDADKAVPSSQSDNIGWAICDAIEDAEKDKLLVPTFQIVYSSRFQSELHLAVRAAAEAKLPVFKSYNEAGSQALLATVNFIEKHLADQTIKIPTEHEDYLLEVIDIPDDFYKKLINEINQLYEHKFVFALSVLVRKLLENLVIDILRKQYGTGESELYYDAKKHKFLNFSDLIENIKDRQADFRYITDSLDNKVINDIKTFKEKGNSGAHSIDSYTTIQQFMEKRDIIWYNFYSVFSRIYLPKPQSDQRDQPLK